MKRIRLNEISMESFRSITVSPNIINYNCTRISLEHPIILIICYFPFILFILPSLVVLGLFPRKIEINYLFIAF